MSDDLNVSIPPLIVNLMSAEPRGAWHLDDMQLHHRWPESGQGEQIKVGLVDTGIDPGHDEVADALEQARDFTGSPVGPKDVQGHGTHCAGLIAGRTCGMAPQAKLYSAKGLGDSGRGSGLMVAKGIDWCAYEGCQIISLSLGSPQRDPVISGAVKRAYDAGIIIVAAAGNDGRGSLSYPAKEDDWVGSVGAVDRQFEHARFSNYGAIPATGQLDLVCYGVDVWSSYQGDYAHLSGTSMATPLIAGLVALRLGGELKNYGEVRTKRLEDLEVFRSAMVDLGKPGYDAKHGHGFPDVEKLLAFPDGEAEQPRPEPQEVAEIIYKMRDGSERRFITAD